jgi:hypothetical protein
MGVRAAAEFKQCLARAVKVGGEYLCIYSVLLAALHG